MKSFSQYKFILFMCIIVLIIVLIFQTCLLYTSIVPVVQKENEAFSALKEEEQKELLRLANIYMENLRTKLNEL